MTSFLDVIKAAGGLIENLVIILMVAALLVFFWGLVKFISKAGDEKAVGEGRNLMVWGLISIFVMVSIWGLVRFIGSELRIGQSTSIPIYP